MTDSIVFLYTELAGYTLACIKELSQKVNDVHVVNWPVNKEAPFVFDQIPNVSFHDRNDHDRSSLLKLVKHLNPSLIICSGWVDKAYVHVCKEHFGKCPTVLTLDNHWENSLSQKVKSLFAKVTFKSVFSHTWVPGKPQLEFTKKLGFSPDKTSTGFYCADLTLFRAPKKEKISKKFLYVGRYLEFKGISELWQAYAELKKDVDSDWELHCAGNGDLWDQRAEFPGITHHGFLQPNELRELVLECDVFILPSHKEPWGVVVHEMAASGLILLCSDKIGAGSEFLVEGENGYTFKATDHSSLLDKMQLVTSLSESKLLDMSKKSRDYAERITPKGWAETAISLIGQS